MLSACDKNANVEVVRQTLNLRNFAFQEIAQFPNDWKTEPEQIWFLATGFYCDCGTVVGLQRAESHKVNEKKT